MKERVIQIVKQAGDIFKQGYFSKKDIQFKGKKDLVTQFDVAIEEFLKKEFKKEFPDFNILAEESCKTNITIDNTIIIDPIDGTTNFVNQVPHCAISIGIYKDKQPYIGVVYNPILDEMYHAQIGKGAYLNTSLISVSSEQSFQNALIATGFPYTSSESKKDLDWIVDKLYKVLPKCQDIRRLGSASIDLCMVSRGIFEGYYEIGLKAWDVAGGIVILKEAGGKISDISDESYDILGDNCIVASNANIHKEFLDILNS